MTTTRKPSEVLADAQHVLERARANLPAFTKKQMHKRCFTRFERKVRDAEKALANPVVAAEPAAEKALRAIYNDALARLAKDAARARLSEIPTEATLADPAARDAANRAGITPARLRALGMLRASLAERPAEESDPAPVLAALAEGAARMRDIAAEIFKKSPARLAEFTKTKRRAAKRASS